MKYYRIYGDDDGMDSDRPFRMPLSACPKCGSGYLVGYEFPSIDLKTVFSEEELEKYFISDDTINIVDWPVFLELQDRIRSQYGAHLDFPMGSGFGRLHGRTNRYATTFIRYMGKTLCCKKATGDSVIAAGCDDLKYVDTKIKSKDGEPYVELILPPVAEVDSSSFKKICEVCLLAMIDVTRLKVIERSLNPSCSLMAARNCRYLMFASEKIKQIYEERALTGLKFYPIQLA